MLIAALHLDLMHQFSIYVAGAIRGALNQLLSDLFPKYMSLFACHEKTDLKVFVVVIPK